MFDAALTGALIDHGQPEGCCGLADDGGMSLGNSLVQASQNPGEHTSTTTDSLVANEVAAQSGGGALYVIDANVDQKDVLIAGLPAGADILMIDSSRDGVVQLAEALSSRDGVAAVHIFAHGTQGELSLGASVLNAETMNGLYRSTLTGMGTHLSENADILVYGCNFADGTPGEAAAGLLASLTGADVAGSDDLTGAARLGGDWDLEYVSGSLETDALVFAAYDATLAPPVAVSETYATAHNTPVSGDVSPNDTDPESDPLTFSVHSQPAHGSVTLNSNGTFTYTPNNGFGGEDFFIYRVTDNTSSNPNFANASVTIVVAAAPNAPPDAVNDSYSTNVNTAVSGDVCANDSDPDGDIVSHSLTTNPSHGTVTLNSNGTFTYTPNTGYTGTDTFTYTSNDGNGGTDTATVTITVSGPSNSPPNAVNDSYSTNVNTAVSGDVCANDSDPDGDIVSHSLTTNPSHGTVTLNSNGTFTYTPNTGYTGTDTFTYTSNDGNGGTDTATVTITVSGPSNSPPNAVNDSYSTSVNTAVSGDVCANDSDPNGDILTHTVATGPSNGTVTLNSNGTFTYTPNTGYTGTDTFTYTSSDGRGGTDTGTVVVTVLATNTNPVIAAPMASQANVDGASITLNLATQVSDADSPVLVYSATGLPPGLSINPLTGMVSGTIDRLASQVGPTSNGVYSVTLTVLDLSGGSATQTFTWTVTNPAPDAVNDAYSVNSGTVLTGSLAPNDSDPDGDSLTFCATTAPANGTVVVNANGSFTYTPNAGFVGTDSFTYCLTDSQGASDSAVATITVIEVNSAPVAVGSVPTQNNLDNGTATLTMSSYFSDPDSNPLTYTVTGLPTGLSIDPTTGVISGTIDRNACAGGPGGNGVYAITVTATDPRGLSAVQSFAWNVTNPGPLAVADNFATTGSTTVTGTVATNDSDPDGDALTFALVSQPTGGTLTFNPNGTFSYTARDLFVGTDSFTYRVTDANGATATAIASIAVAAPAVAPVSVTCINTFGDLSHLRSLLAGDGAITTPPPTTTPSFSLNGATFRPWWLG
ncbi:MAG TPA: Ig-like domain-containing protein [Beijerinckiaceae bacterium]|nr:Ig-like domain-containing protein [Beijerinckiaceae bacterium]